MQTRWEYRSNYSTKLGHLVGQIFPTCGKFRGTITNLMSTFILNSPNPHRVGGILNYYTTEKSRSKFRLKQSFGLPLSPIENTVLAIFDPRLSIVKSVFDCRLPGVKPVSVKYKQVSRLNC